MHTTNTIRMTYQNTVTHAAWLNFSTTSETQEKQIGLGTMNAQAMMPQALQMKKERLTENISVS